MDSERKESETMACIGVDLTERRRAEARLQESESLYRTIFENNLNPIAVIDTEGHYLEANRAFYDFTQTDPHTLLNRSVFEFSPPSRKEKQEEEHRPAWSSGGTFETEYLIGDQIKTLELSVTPIQYKGRKAVVGIGVDTTERKKTEAALRESEAEKKAILDSSVDSIRLVDKEMRILWTNKIIEKQVGGNRHEIIGNYCYRVYTGRDKPCPNCPTVKAQKSGKTEHSIICEENVKGIPGTTYWADYTVPLKDESGEIVRFLQVSRDITAIKASEREKEALIRELKEALSAVKTLSGLLPICSICKRIRNDEGYWDMLESYIMKHSTAQFSHSICPECLKEHYPDYDPSDD